MNNYEKLRNMLLNKICHLDNIDTSEPDTIQIPEPNQRRKPGRPKVTKKPSTTEEIILEEYKQLELSYNLLEVEYELVKKELEILKNQTELKELQSKKAEIANSMHSK